MSSVIDVNLPSQKLTGPASLQLTFLNLRMKNALIIREIGVDLLRFLEKAGR